MGDDKGETARGTQEVLAWLLAEPPGPRAISVLAEIDPASLTYSQQVDLLIVYERQAAWLAAGQQRLLAALTARGNDQL